MAIHRYPFTEYSLQDGLHHRYPYTVEHEVDISYLYNKIKDIDATQIGSLEWDDETQNLTVKDPDGNVITTVEITLPQGSQGPVGPQGPQGIQGEPGPQGERGPQGEQGIQGPKGDRGSQGVQGIQGPKGDKGDTGATGPQGPQGIQGIKGDTGDQGPKGEPGETGERGPQGIQGEKGDTGDTGPQGIQGPQGPTGATGPQGPQGEKGDPGEAMAILAKYDTYSQFIAAHPTGSEGDVYQIGTSGSGGAKNIWYGTCPTGATTATKVVTTSSGDFELSTGNILIVKFTYGETAASPKLQVDNTTATSVNILSGASARYFWEANDIVAFVYDGANFVRINSTRATTTYSGLVTLSNSTSSTSSSVAATSKAVNDVVSATGSGGNLETITVKGTTYNVAGGGGGGLSVLQINASASYSRISFDNLTEQNEYFFTDLNYNQVSFAAIKSNIANNVAQYVIQDANDSIAIMINFDNYDYYGKFSILYTNYTDTTMYTFVRDTNYDDYVVLESKTTIGSGGGGSSVTTYDLYDTYGSPIPFSALGRTNIQLKDSDGNAVTFATLKTAFEAGKVVVKDSDMSQTEISAIAGNRAVFYIYSYNSSGFSCYVCVSQSGDSWAATHIYAQ